MLEKDIENLLAQHPEEFFPKLGLKLIAQQKKLGNYRADILFEDADGNTVIVEVKRGILTREKLGSTIVQIMDYYGMLKLGQPDTSIKLVIVANVIPKERTLLAQEQLKIAFKEIPASQIYSIAEKHSYTFLDADKPEQKHSYNLSRTEIDDNVKSGTSRVWIFQSNPQRYDILDALADKSLKEDVWLVNRHKDEIKNGDIALIWMSGKDAGIYAVADIISDPQMLKETEEAAQYWISDEDVQQVSRRVKIRYRIRLLNDPVLRAELKNIPELENLSIFRFAQGTNFKVTEEEWKIISDILKQRFSM